jgi:hypothetical protein
MMMPFWTATPNRAMNPTAVAMLSVSPRRQFFAPRALRRHSHHHDCCDRLKQRRLAGAIGTDQTQYLAGSHRHVDVGDVD